MILVGKFHYHGFNTYDPLLCCLRGEELVACNLGRKHFVLPFLFLVVYNLLLCCL